MKKKHSYYIDWEELGKLDPKWAILTFPSKKYNRWDEREFFETGEKEIQSLLEAIKNLHIDLKFGEALDFGCGIGRLTVALSRHFNKVYGVDISETMIHIAKRLHNENGKIIFLQNTTNYLSCFESNKFDLILSLITLQHIPERDVISKYLLEFLRTLKPGGVLYFQLPMAPALTKLRSAVLRVRGYIYHLFVKIGFSREFCFRYLLLAPYMHMSYMPIHEIESLFYKKASILQVYNAKAEGASYLVQKESTLLGNG